MATSRTELVNRALTLVGANPIVNIDDDTQNARIIKRVYELSLKSILSETQWNFATKRKLLALADVTLEWEDTGEIYVYQKPTLCIRVFGTNSPSATWREEGEYIISDTSGLGIRYVQFLNEPSKYPSSFVEAFIDKLCSDIAYMILNSKSVAESFYTKYEQVSLPKAMAENAQIGTPVYQRDSEWLEAKWGGTTDRADYSYS